MIKNASTKRLLTFNSFMDSNENRFDSWLNLSAIIVLIYFWVLIQVIFEFGENHTIF